MYRILQAAYENFIAGHDPILSEWRAIWGFCGHSRVVLKVASYVELLALYEKGRATGLPAHVIYNASRTEVEVDRAAVLVLGPAPDCLIDPIIHHLQLL